MGATLFLSVTDPIRIPGSGNRTAVQIASIDPAQPVRQFIGLDLSIPSTQTARGDSLAELSFVTELLNVLDGAVCC